MVVQPQKRKEKEKETRSTGRHFSIIYSYNIPFGKYGQNVIVFVGIM